MAATTDRARFYLEKYVPELQEYQQKGIFSRDEIASITSKRSEFEHILNARGSTPADYARYAAYEMNLDNLRKKRCKRLGVKSMSFSGQRTVFFVLDRATKKFPGDMGLWMQYINFCKKEKANKKLSIVFTKVLRLQPRNWNLWILAAKHYVEVQGDMGTARSYMQRGLRFCKDERNLYLEYAKLEMIYLAKLAARKNILGLDKPRQEVNADEDENYTALPSITAADLDPDVKGDVEQVNQTALKKLENAPAFSGAIPMAIFDAAMLHFAKNGPELAEDFFDLVLSFESVPASQIILQHILTYLQRTAMLAPERLSCEAKRQFFGIDTNTADFPQALSTALKILREGIHTVAERERTLLAQKAVLSLLPFTSQQAPEKPVQDEDIYKVLRASIKRYLRIIAEIPVKLGQKDAFEIMTSSLEKKGWRQEIEELSRLNEEMKLG